MVDLNTQEDSNLPLNSVAIVGIAGRFPDADNTAQFWQNLCDGIASLTRFTDAELEDSFDAATRSSANFVKARPILKDIERFDAEFFSMYAKEAELTDPQQRVFLEICWEALEDAGYDPATYAGSIGVFAGSSPNTYFLRNVLKDRRTIEDFTSNYQVGMYPMLLGAGADFLATRVSYKLDLRGPALTLQTACSTSLLAIAKACQSLLLFESDMMLAGGVSITLPQRRGYQHLEGGMVSSDGTCRPFDASASGTIFGSGAGVVLLKRLEDAITDGDHIYAVIRGSGVNNDGAGKVGFTAPSVEGQAAAIEMALASSGLDARSISYVECHGTATPLGDPIEIAGLAKAFAQDPEVGQFCAIGSVKSNVGHLDAAAGVAALIKTSLALKHGALPPSLHYQRPNPNIDFSKTPFYVNDKLRPWTSDAAPRRAGVSAFGVGGTNVHVVLEEAPQTETVSPADAPQLLVLSARSAAALATARQNLAEHLKTSAVALADVAFTLQTGRRAFEHRLAVAARDLADAASKLADTGKALPSGKKSAQRPRVVFMFPGQGSQHPGMARDLYLHEPVFRDEVDRCADILKGYTGADLRELLYPRELTEDAKQKLMATIAAQPAIFTVEYALAKLWQSRGVQPDAMIGHSIGEFVAAVLAGVFSLQDALKAVAERGRLMQSLPGGAMLAVRQSEAQVREVLPQGLAIAAINGPSLCVVAGAYEAVDAFEKLLVARGVTCRRLHTSHAFHSSMVEPVVAPLRATFERIALAAPKIPYVSCVSGTWISAEQATQPLYWASHAREAVRFNDGVQTLCADGPVVLIEVGPGNALSTLALQGTKGRNVPVITSLQDVEHARDDRECVLEAMGRAWTLGVLPDWQTFHTNPVRRVSLPTYPFQRSRHWIDMPVASATTLIETNVSASPSPPSVPQEASSMNQTAVDNRESEVRARIAAILEDLSGERPESLDSEVSFLEMGYDSLFLTQVAQRIDQLMKVKITFRQLLGDHSTIPTLARYLAELMPATAFAAPAAPAPAAMAAPAASAAAPRPALAVALPAGAPAMGGVEGLFRDQLQAMNQLISRQFEMLQSMGGAPLAAAPPAMPAAAPVNAPAPKTPATAAAAEPVAADQPRSALFKFYDPKAARRPNDSGITPQQRKHIDELIALTLSRTPGSKKDTATYRAVSADPRVAAGFRSEWKEMVYPLVVTKAAGSKLIDVDGNDYVDIVNGYGQTALGHAPDYVVAAVKAQLDKGFAIGPQAELTGKVAQLFCELTGNERMAFCNTGSEAVMAAMRVARTVTGREKIVVFNGDYHGQFDEVLVKGVQKAGADPRSMPSAPGIPSSTVKNMIVLEYGSAQTLQWIRDNAQDLAAVVVEPVQSRHPNLQPFDFIREIRKITEASGTAFVMDEVVTGFRVHPGGMQSVVGVRADMATYGKIVGGGLPVGCIAGKAKFMDALDGGNWNYGDDSIPETGVTFFAGTFVRHPLLLASAWAVLNHLKNEGPELQERLTAKTAALVKRLNAMFASHGVKNPIETFASLFYFNFHGEHPLSTLFYYHVRARGVHIQEGFPCFLTTAHADEDYERIFRAFEGAVIALRSVGVFGSSSEPAVAASAPAAAAPVAAAPVAAAPTVVAGPVPPTESQMEIWLAAQMGDEASCAFNESVTLRMQGSLNASHLERAMDEVLARHDALRATFSPTGEEMHIAPAGEFHYPVTDLSHLPAAEAEAAYAKMLDADARTAFDLVAGPCVRAHLVKLGAQTHALMLTAHHIVCDGWSINILVSELTDIYGKLCRGESTALPAPMAFSSYALAQTRRDPAELAKTEQYWLNQFKTPVSLLDLPTDRQRPSIKSFKGASHLRRIDADLYKSLKKTGARHKSTLFVTLLAAFQALMGRLANQREVVVGVPTAGQSLIEDQILVGHCVNFLPIRSEWSPSTSLGELLGTTAKRVLDTYEHQSYTFGTLVRKLAVPREPGRLPLTEVQFNLERLSETIQLPSLSVEVAPNAKTQVNFDLFLNVVESSEGLRLFCDYNTDLFDEATVDHWLRCYEALLQAIVADSAQSVSRASIIPAAERQVLLEQLNATATPYPREASVLSLVEEQARATPAAPAVQFAATTLSYEALDRRANQIANLLITRMGPGKRGRMIGVCVERSVDMLAALIAVHKAGCAYVPLDPMHPPARLRGILGEAEVAALICDGSELAPLTGDDVPRLDVKAEAAAIAAASDRSPGVAVHAEDLAYVIYTSGSTGKPKGVEISHRAVVNLLSSMAKEPGLKRDDTLYAVTTISFDIAGLELFLPLIVGAKVVIGEREVMADGFALLKQLQDTRATMMQATPAAWRMLLEAGFRAPSGFKMLCGGEALPRELANRLLEGQGELWNMYGPTETTIWSSCARVTAGTGPITVGKPIANTQFYVLDASDQPTPLGVPGQLHIGGDGVARGYYKRAELTAEKFLHNPFIAGRIYRTGDLARWLPDGSLQVLGRIDHQIKLRGFRIELGEIESLLMRKAQLADATVILREDSPGAQRLVAYYVTSAGSSHTPDSLRALLQEDLPDYMVPAALVPLERLPISPNGKLDRSALPVPNSLQSGTEEYIAPSTATETALIKIFGEVLKMERISVKADLLRMGVDSIQLFQITARANRSGLSLNTKQLLQLRTAAAVAAAMDSRPANSASPEKALPSLSQFSRRRPGTGTQR